MLFYSCFTTNFFLLWIKSYPNSTDAEALKRIISASENGFSFLEKLYKCLLSYALVWFCLLHISRNRVFLMRILLNFITVLKFSFVMNIFEEKVNYELFLLMSEIGRKKMRVLLLLSHLHPRVITSKYLSNLLGFTSKSRIIYRGYIESLVDKQLVICDKIASNQSIIRLNQANPIVQRMISISKQFGERFLRKLRWKEIEDKTEKQIIASAIRFVNIDPISIRNQII